MEKHVTIIGAGIGGLTTALTLQQKDFQVTVYESASEIKPVGAGIIMANNAMQIFQKLGIQHKIENAGNKISSIKITDEQLSVLSELNLHKFEEKYKTYNVAIHRSDLLKILSEAVGMENIILSKRLSKIERNESFVLTFEDGTTVKSDILIGADGINSVVREQLFEPSIIRETNQLCWRGVTEVSVSEKYQHDAYEAWGKGKRFGIVKINDTKTYWFAVVNDHLANKQPIDLSDLFKSFHKDVLALINSTPEKDIFKSEIKDLKPISKWQSKNVCLIGDAAHATTPNLGQGACQAIEDAYTIGQLLESDKSFEQVFKEYERLRVKRAHYIVNTSWRMGKIGNLENNLGIWARNTTLRMTPESMNSKQLDKIFSIDYVFNKSRE